MSEQTTTTTPPADASADQSAEPRNMVRELIDAGVHFGHRSSRWNPKMGAFIYGKRNRIHILDIRETLKGLLRAKKFISQVVAGGDDVVFVGTKRQARHTIAEQANRCEMPYVSERWLGGTLTNFRTIRSRLSRLEELESLEEAGQLDAFSKKQAASHRREKRKILRNLGGIRNMNRIPGAMVVIDVRRENIAVREAQKVGVPVIGLIDTDSDPDLVDLPIPGNDDAMRAIELVLTELAEAAIQGKSNRAAAQEAAKAGESPALRRSRRMTTTQKYEQQLTPTEQKIHAVPPSVLEVTPGAAEAEEARESAAEEAPEKLEAATSGEGATSTESDAPAGESVLGGAPQPSDEQAEAPTESAEGESDDKSKSE